MVLKGVERDVHEPWALAHLHEEVVQYLLHGPESGGDRIEGETAIEVVWHLAVDALLHLPPHLIEILVEGLRLCTRRARQK